MTNVPGTPNLQLHPFASDSTLDFYWRLPTNQGDSAVNTYTLRCASIPFSTIIRAPDTHAKVSSLTNGQDYAFEIAATNVNGTGRYIPFQVSQPGVTPGGPRNFGYSLPNSSTISFTWNFSTNVNEGANRNFAIEVIPSTVGISPYYIGLYNTQREHTITTLPTDSYIFRLYSINDAGYNIDTPNNVVSSIIVSGLNLPPTVLSVSPYTSESNYPLTHFTLNLTDLGVPGVTELGVVWSFLNNSPTVGGEDCFTHTTTVQLGSQIININAVNGGLVYAAAYATNSGGTVYGSVLTVMANLCLAKGTLITLYDGSEIPIENIKYSDKLLVWNFDDGLFDAAQPLWIKRVETANQYNLLKFSNGAELKTIDQHRIFNVEKGMFTYPMTDDTPEGTTSFAVNSDSVTLVSKEIIVEQVDYYNVITEKHINLFANGILTSCRYNNLYPIKNMRFEKTVREVLPKEAYVGITDRYYDGLRLAEQNIPCEDTLKYIDRLERLKQ